MLSKNLYLGGMTIISKIIIYFLKLNYSKRFNTYEILDICIKTMSNILRVTLNTGPWTKSPRTNLKQIEP